MRSRTVVTKSRFPLLKSTGMALEYFPEYINSDHIPHSVDVVLLTFVLAGEGQHVMEGSTFEETPGTLSITHYGQEHFILTQGMEIMNIYLDIQNHPLPVLPNELQAVLPQLLPLHPNLYSKLNKVIRLNFAGRERTQASDLLTLMIREQENPQKGWVESLNLYLKLFLIQCSRLAVRQGITSAETSGSTAALEALRRKLDREFTQTHTHRDLADFADLSPTYLCRAFKNYTGRSLFQYITERRIQAAMYILRTTSKKILPVALECGFNDVSHFGRQFKKITGSTPSAYRDRSRQA